jgi:hypothetical protein
MLDYLKVLRDDEHDAYFFLPGPKDDTIHLEGATYKDAGENVGHSAMGNAYHVILFKEDEEGELVDIDMFEAIFMDPLEYMSNLIPSGIFGIMARKTTTSNNFIQKTFDKLIKT